MGYEKNVFSSSWKTSGKFGDFIVCFLISVLFVQEVIVFFIVATGEAVRLMTSGLSEGEEKVWFVENTKDKICIAENLLYMY